MENKSHMFTLMKQRGKNQLDDLTMGLVNAMKYSNSDVEYPSYDKAKAGEGVNPEWFYAIYRGTNGFSELNAINQYISQEAMFDDIGELMMGIALVEMKHLDKLGDFILKLGGIVTQEYDTKYVSYGNSAEEAVKLGIKAEQDTIDEYNRIAEKVLTIPQNDTTKIALQLLSKLIEDEKFHIQLFQQWLNDNKDK